MSTMKSFVRQLSEAFSGKSQPELNKGNSLDPESQGMHKSKSSEIHSLKSSRSAEILERRKRPDPRRDALFRPSFSKPIGRVQEVDRSFFESFTALCWRQENRRLQQLREESSVENFSIDGITPWTSAPKAVLPVFKSEWEQLYLEVLYTLRHRIGARNPQDPASIPPGDLIKYSQAAFGADLDTHLKFCAAASEEKAPILVLNVIVYEAEGLEAKDPNGFSDPYCMLGIQLGNISSSPPRDFDDYSPNDPGERPSGGRRDSLLATQVDKFKRSGGFRISFKKRDGPPVTPQTRREQSQHRDSVLPAKFIRATSVRPHTLNPKWNEKFRFDIDDPSTDQLHLDIWDHDDEYSVLEAVSKLNEVRGVKGLGRFFKQIAQSARGSGIQDDFLGCVNIALSDMPSTGLELWAKLEARSNRSNIQGRIRLKLWLSTREDFGVPEDDTLIEVRQQEQLHAIFIDYELAKFGGPAWQWAGDLPPEAHAVLHQHAIQGDVTPVQSSMVKWLAYSRKLYIRSLHFAILETLLIELEETRSSTDPLSKDEEELLGTSFTEFLSFCIKHLKYLRYHFTLSQAGSMSNLESMLRCLMYMTGMHYYRKSCPFNKELRGELMTAIRRGTIEWYSGQCERFLTTDLLEKDLVDAPVPMARLVSNLVSDLQRALQSYNPLFIRETNVPYFTIVYKTIDRMVHDDLGPRIGELLEKLNEPNASPSTSIFELYMALRELTVLREHLTIEDLRILGPSRYHEWFHLALDKWLDTAYEKALCRIRAAVDADRISGVEKHERQSTSAIDTTSCFYQIREFWKQLSWPDPVTGGNFSYKICETVSACTTLYADLIFQKIQNSGLLDDSKTGPVPEELLVVLNSLEHVRKSVEMLPSDLKLLEEAPPSPLRTGSNNNYEPTTRQAASALLEEAVDQLDARALRIIGHLAEQLRPEVRRHVFHLAWSPDSLPAESALAPLLDSLDVKLTEFRTGLLDTAFKRALVGVWDILLVELELQGDANTGEKLTPFYERLHRALQLLEEFFHAEGAGVSIDGLHTPTWIRLASRLDLDRTLTQTLMNLYYKERLDDQLTASEMSGFGALSVRAYFHHDSLCVEVLGARDVIPLDPNGLSDPFVIVELLPKTVFLHCIEQRTAVHRKTLHPIFDECFEFSVTAKQCRSDGAMILFTVMDYDVITANDFAGEAFLSLSSIPGICNGGYGVDNFHGLRPVELPLMQQPNKGHPVLKVLDTRIWDKVAQDFVKKQKERFVQ